MAGSMTGPIITGGKPEARNGGGVSFMPSADNVTVGGSAADVLSDLMNGALDVKAGTPFSMLTGRDHIASTTALKTNVETLADGANASANIQSGITVQGVKADLQDAKANFVADLQQTQAVMAGALEKAVENTGVDPSHAANSFIPAAQRSDTTTTAGLALGGTVASLGALGELQSILAKKLTPEDECRVAEQAAKCLLPLRDSQGNVIAEPKIPNNFDQEFLEKQNAQQMAQLLKDIMRPAEDQPEMKYFADLEAQLEPVIAVHNRNLDRNEVASAFEHNTGIDIDVKDVAVCAPEITGYEDYGISTCAVEHSELAHAGLVDPSKLAAPSFRDIAALLQTKPPAPPVLEYNKPDDSRLANSAMTMSAFAGATA